MMNPRAVLLLSIFLSGCQQSCARNMGGTVNIEIEQGRKVIGAGWKDKNVWYLTRPAHENEPADDVIYQESTKTGLMESKVIFHEQALPKKMPPMPVYRPGERP